MHNSVYFNCIPDKIQFLSVVKFSIPDRIASGCRDRIFRNRLTLNYVKQIIKDYEHTRIVTQSDTDIRPKQARMTGKVIPPPKSKNKKFSLIRWPACKRTRKGNAISNPNKALMVTGFYIHQLPFTQQKFLQEQEYKIESNPRYFLIYRTQFSRILPFQIYGSRTTNLHDYSITTVSNHLHRVRNGGQI